MTGRYGIILVGSASHALRAEALLEAQGIRCKLIPVPRWLSTDCGICVRVPHDDAARAAELLRRQGVEVVGLHQMEQ